MPELPEVETIARALRGQVVGQAVSAAQVRWPRAVATPAPDEFVAALVGRRITAVGRRAKFLVLALAPQGYLLIHLRMTGRLLYEAAGAAPRPLDGRTHVSLYFQGGGALHYHDQRKFGRLYLVGAPDEILRGLGPEPLEASPEQFAALLRARRRQIKPLLLDQHVLAGLGNIYVDESLWRAGVHPLRRADTLAAADISRLYEAIRAVLTEAIANKGTTLRDYRAPSGETGENQWALAVYGRAGEPCPRCGQAVQRVVVGSRGTHLCPQCQPL